MHSILEIVVLTFVYLYCIVSFVLFVCYVFSDKFHVRLLYDRICGPTEYVCMYVLCMCVYACMYVCMLYVCIMYVCVCMHVCICVYIYVCMLYVCIMYVCVCMHVCMYVVSMYYVCMHACMFVCMYVRIFLFIACSIAGSNTTCLVIICTIHCLKVVILIIT